MTVNNTKYLLSFLLILQILTSCQEKDHCIPSPDISDISIDLQIERLDKRLFAAESKKEIGNILNHNPVFSEYILSKSQYPHDSVLINRFYDLLRNPEIQVLWEETNQKFKNLSELEKQFSEAFRRIKYHYPGFKAPRIKTVFTGLTHDMYVSDTLLIIGLDYYLGEGATYRPLNIPDYILKRYRKENIVPNTLLLFSDKYIESDQSNQSLLADMIYYGKAHYFAKHMLPCVPDSIFLGYTPVEMVNIDRSEAIIWANFIENELLFETNYFMKDKFISERPKTFEIGQNCPGRIGRWVGWNIIRAYMDKNEDVSLPDMMKDTQVLKIFEKSRYKPRS